MRILYLADSRISQSDLKKVHSELAKIYSTNADITPVFHLETMDFEHTVFNSRNKTIFDTLPYWFIKRETDNIFKRWTEEIDHVAFMVHDQNWRGDAIWGENFSNLFNGYQVHICRFDSKNLANSLGTLYHEIHHSHDALIELLFGIRIEEIVDVDNWDEDITHGGKNPPWQYMRHKENQESLRLIAPQLQAAYAERKEVFDTRIKSMQKQIIKLLKRHIVLLREKRRRLREGASRKCSI